MSELKRSLRDALESENNLDSDHDFETAEPTLTKDLDRDEPLKTKKSRFGIPRKNGKRKRHLTLAVLPTSLTLGNGVCGLSAIAVATSANLPWENETKLLVAGLLIFGGMLFDALDGSAARLTGQESEFGAQLDSLCDAITFGTAPAVIVWRISDAQGFSHKLSLCIGVLFALCVLIRLARFNVETDEDDTHEGFEGLPSPAAAGAIAAFAIAEYEFAGFGATEYPESVRLLAGQLVFGSQYVITALACVLAYLMISRYQYPHVFNQLLKGRRSPHQIGQAMFIVIGAFLLHWLTLPIVFCYYAFGSPARYHLASWRKTKATA